MNIKSSSDVVMASFPRFLRFDIAHSFDTFHHHPLSYPLLFLFVVVAFYLVSTLFSHTNTTQIPSNHAMFRQLNIGTIPVFHAQLTNQDTAFITFNLRTCVWFFPFWVTCDTQQDAPSPTRRRCSVVI
eukprot:628620_1